MVLPGLVMCTLRLERGYATFELEKMCVGATTISSAVAAVLYSLKALVVSVKDYDQVLVSGPMGLFGSLAVAIMQQTPDASFLIFPNMSIQATLLPSLVIILAIFSSLGSQSFLPIILASSGILTTYWYLRFLRLTDGQRGDRSIAMSFSVMFPVSLQFLAEFLATKSYRLAAKFDRWEILQECDIEGRIVNRRVSAQEIERRRLLAIQLLNEKLAQKKEQETFQDDITTKPNEPITTTISNVPSESGRPMMLQQA